MNNLADLRKQIDELDNDLLRLLQKRVALVRKVGEVKKSLQQPIRDEQREHQQLTHLEQKAQALHIPQSLVTAIWKVFLAISEEIEK